MIVIIRTDAVGKEDDFEKYSYKYLIIIRLKNILLFNTGFVSYIYVDKMSCNAIKTVQRVLINPFILQITWI
ncbi:hypothetical protein J9874_03890 (plasmid) [Duffyella gerundensis]|nr:hypothetical protein J9874_03890 [Duffyella gerundensis]